MTTISAYDVPKKALIALAIGSKAPEEVLEDFEFDPVQITWLLQDTVLADLVKQERDQLEKAGVMDLQRIRMHAITQMEQCTRLAAAGRLTDVQVKYLDVLMKGANLNAVDKSLTAGPAGPQFSIQFILKPPGREPATIDVTPTRDPNEELTRLLKIELPTEVF